MMETVRVIDALVTFVLSKICNLRMPLFIHKRHALHISIYPLEGFMHAVCYSVPIGDNEHAI